MGVVSKKKKVKDHLLPDRHPQRELFVCDVADAVLKDDIASMEHPFYSLSKKPDIKEREYRNGDKWLKVTPSVRGLATIYDKDVLIYCISQVIAKMGDDEPVSRTLKITARDLLIFTNRETSGRHYDLLLEGLVRLRGTVITTNISSDGALDEEITDGFGLIEDFRIKRSTKSNRISELTVTLSEWVFDAIRNRSVLTLHPDYFRLKRPLERRVYEIARKHCGKQVRWVIGIDKLKNKCGSRGTLFEFRRLMKELVEGDHLPDYRVEFCKDKQQILFFNREAEEEEKKYENEMPKLDTETYHEARTVAPGYDVYWLEKEWQKFWLDSGRPELKNPDKAFLGFCRRRAQTNPNP